MSKIDYVKIKEDILLKAHQQYVDWWLPIDVAAGSVLAPMGLYMFCHRMITMPENEFFDRWIDETELPIPVNGDIRMARIYMKDFIVKRIIAHVNGNIDLHNKGNEFKWIEKTKSSSDHLEGYHGDVDEY
jgi:hypothetical protein